MFGLGNTPKVARSVELVRETGPAVSLDKVEQAGGLSLRKKTEAAGVALAASGLAGIRAQAVLVLDYSGSMGSDYRSGEVQTLAERFLAFALQIDADGEVPMIPFASDSLPTINVHLDNFQGIIDRELVRKQAMGSTNLFAALVEVKKLAEKTDAPLFVGVVTDGNPDSTTATTRIVTELANYPAFIKFMALREVPYLDELDNLPNTARLLDNVNTQVFPNLNLTDQAFAEAMAEEWDEWVKAAISAGLLT